MTHTLSLRQLFPLFLILFAGLLAASLLQAWTGPTGTAPANNIAAPINVGATDQVKDAGLSVNALTVFGSEYIQSKLGVGAASPVVAIETPGTIKIGSGGEVCQAVTEGSQRYNSGTKVMEYCNGTTWGPVGGGTSSATIQTYATPGTYTWTKPSTGSLAVLECWGGGAGGWGGLQGTQNWPTYFGGAGGAGGGYSTRTVALSALPAPLMVTVGAGGAGGAAHQYGGEGSSGGFGSDGGVSSIGSLITAYGGTLFINSETGDTQPLGGSALTETGGSPFGITSATFMPIPGPSPFCSGASGGKGGGTYYVNSTVIILPSPAGLSGCGGNGGASGASGVAGSAGTAPGGGGGGGGKSPTAGAGGAGAAGRCVITVI